MTNQTNQANQANLTKDAGIMKIAEEIREKAAQGRYRVSDAVLRDHGREYQFTDLVMEGGGTLGIALVGYIHALEQADVRFLGMGGSSVGAIVALLAYGCGDRMEAKGEKLADIIADMDLGGMVDGRWTARRLSRLMGNKDARLRMPRIFLAALFSLCPIFSKLGLNPGDKLYTWISDRLKDNGIETLADLRRLTDTLPPGLVHRETGEAITQYDASLKIVAADITTSTKVIFPHMAPMYWASPDGINPACFARASASIPIFFQPFVVEGVSELIKSGENWKKLGSFTGELPNTVSFADGGLLSNFPIDLFFTPGVPRAPTLGARLGGSRRTVKDAKTVGQYASHLFGAMRHYADYDFILRNPLYRQLIAHIPTDNYNWLDFAMTPEDKLGLFREGMQAGQAFLEGFNWDEHKRLRRLS
ncbi:MAG: patatin-like phospholipase family protein [Oscillospiraceae bacterium]|nr:patatin-like phospholipase family protein [Oscillospiraceae bacterium]